jgi:hypothetical protein
VTALAPATSAAAAGPVSVTTPLAAARAAALGMRAVEARIEVPHDDVSFEDGGHVGDRIDPVESYRRHVNAISVAYGWQVSAQGAWRQMMTSADGGGGQLVTSAVVNLAHAIEQKMTM